MSLILPEESVYALLNELIKIINKHAEVDWPRRVVGSGHDVDIEY